MYAQVVVLTYQSPQIDSYTYKVPDNLVGKIKIGQLVSVPFGKRNPMGVITSIVDRPSTIVKNIKPISSIILGKPFLLPYQIKLLNWMAAYYLAPMINCLDAMLPEIPKRLINQQSPITNHQSIQTLVLVPSINQLPQTLAQFPQAKNYAVYTNELKTSEKISTWLKILSGQTDFIFGSRSAIFVPCPNLKKMIIFDEHESAYKDSRSPYFDTLTVAEKISSLTGAKIEIIDASPRITTYFNYSRNIKVPSIKIQTKIISLENERKLGNYSPISNTLEEIIKRAYLKKLSILLFLNKKIESGSIYCKTCKHQEFAKTQPNVCPNCQSTEIFFNSTNINSLAKELKRILPNSTVNLVAEGLKQSPIRGLIRRKALPIPHKFGVNNQQSTIDIATSAVFYRLLSKKYDLVAHIYADSPLNFNEYSAQETTYSQITNLKKLSRKLLVIQTYNDQNPGIVNAASGNYSAFAKFELSQRKTLSYPPFSLLVKISIRGKDEESTEQKSQDYKDKLEKLLTTHYSLPTTLLGPYKSLNFKKLSYNIMLKIQLVNYKLYSREKALEKISEFMPKEKNIKIEVEPITLN